MLAELLAQLQKQQADGANFTAVMDLGWNSLDDFTQQIAMLLSLFAPTPIPQAMLEQVAEGALDTSIDREAIAPACDTLTQRFLLQRIDATIYQLHTPVWAYLQTKLKQSTQSDRYKQAFAQVMITFAKRLSDPPSIAECTDFAPAIPHIVEAATTWQTWLTDENIVLPYFCLGRFYAAQGALEQAAQWYEQGLLEARKRLGNEHPAIATSLTNLANLYKAQGRYREAKSLYQQALDLSQQQVKEENLPSIDFLTECIDWIESKLLVHLRQWLEQNYELEWQAPGKLILENRSIPQPVRSKSSVRRAKRIESDFNGQTLALQVQLTATGTEDFTIIVRLSPTNESDNQFLPQGIQLQLLDEMGVVCPSVQAGENSLYLKQELTGKSGERFSLKIVLRDISHVEEFLI
jgi:tetratricopeptide (TPR) repeat protein